MYFIKMYSVFSVNFSRSGRSSVWPLWLIENETRCEYVHKMIQSMIERCNPRTHQKRIVPSSAPGEHAAVQSPGSTQNLTAGHNFMTFYQTLMLRDTVDQVCITLIHFTILEIPFCRSLIEESSINLGMECSFPLCNENVQRSAGKKFERPSLRQVSEIFCQLIKQFSVGKLYS